MPNSVIKTKTIFLFCAYPEKFQKKIVKEMKKRNYPVKQPKTLDGLELNGDDIVVVDVRDIDDWKEQMKQRKDANYIPIESYVSCKPFPGREMSERVKVNAGYLEKTIQKCSCGKEGMVLSKKEYEKKIKKEEEGLLKYAVGNKIRQVRLMKAALLNLKHKPTKCLAMKYEAKYGDLLQRLMVEREGTSNLKTIKEAIETVEDFLWF